MKWTSHFLRISLLMVYSLTSTGSALCHAAQGGEGLKNAFGGGFVFGYLNDTANGIGCVFSTPACDFPEHSLNSGFYLEYARVLGSRQRWDLRLAAGYQRMLAHSSHSAPIPDKTNIQVDLLADYYFRGAPAKWRPYFGFGVASRSVPGFTFRPALAFALGTGYALTDRLTLKTELKAATLIGWTFVEPSLGVLWRF